MQLNILPVVCTYVCMYTREHLHAHVQGAPEAGGCSAGAGQCRKTAGGQPAACGGPADGQPTVSRQIPPGQEKPPPPAPLPPASALAFAFEFASASESTPKPSVMEEKEEVRPASMVLLLKSK